MLFESPIWLIALVPWAMLMAWLMVRRAPVVWVPYARLWRAPRDGRSHRRGWSRLPWGTLMLLVAMLAGIVGAARPMFDGLRTMAEPITVVVDRGVTMSCREAGELRFRQAALDVQQVLSERFGPGQAVNLLLVPGGGPVHTDVRGWITQVQGADPTAVDTREMVERVVGSELQSSRGMIVVLSDQLHRTPKRRLIDVQGPELQSVTIAAVAARMTPHPQVMIGVRNQSSLRRARVGIDSGDVHRQIDIDLPPPGHKGDIFVDLPSLSPTLRVHLEAGSVSSPADWAYLARTNRVIRVIAASPLPSALQRMVSLYNQSQGASDDPAVVAVIAGSPGVIDNRAAVLIASGHITANGRPVVDALPITAHVQWEKVLAGAALAGPPGGSWRSVVQAGDHPAVMIQAGPPRRMWVGIDSPQWARSADYVIFWKNAFDWLGGGSGVYAAKIVGEPAGSWQAVDASRASASPDLWPGIYRQSDGRLAAVNAPDVQVRNPTHAPWREQIQELSARAGGGGNVSRWLYTAAIACVLLAAWIGLR